MGERGSCIFGQARLEWSRSLSHVLQQPLMVSVCDILYCHQAGYPDERPIHITLIVQL